MSAALRGRAFYPTNLINHAIFNSPKWNMEWKQWLSEVSWRHGSLNDDGCTVWKNKLLCYALRALVQARRISFSGPLMLTQPSYARFLQLERSDWKVRHSCFQQMPQRSSAKDRDLAFHDSRRRTISVYTAPAGKIGTPSVLLKSTFQHKISSTPW